MAVDPFLLDYNVASDFLTNWLPFLTRGLCNGCSAAASNPSPQRELIRFRKVQRKKDFSCQERVKGRVVNVLAGLELHTGVFSAAEQKRIVDFVFELQDKGRKNELGEHTYSKPRKWMRGKGRETI